MGAQEYNKEKNISLKIKLPKTCYYPGEKMKGTITLQLMRNNISPILQFPKAILKIEEFQQYQFPLNESFFTEKEKKEIITKTCSFKKFKGRDLTTPLKIRFSLRIPEKINPTIITKNSLTFVKHFFSIEFPEMFCKKTIIIIIKNQQLLKKGSHLFKKPLEKFIDLTIAKPFSKSSKVVCLFRSDKNSYKYNEIIKYEIILNKTELEIEVKSLEISLNRKYGYYDDLQLLNEVQFERISSDKYEHLMNNKIHKICGLLRFPKNITVNPMSAYEYFNDKDLDDVYMKFPNVRIYPTSYLSLVKCNYFLQLDIVFDSFGVSSEFIILPIEFYTPKNEDEEEQIDKEDDDEDKEKEIIINNENNGENLNSDYLNETPGGLASTPDSNNFIYDQNLMNQELINDYNIIQKEDFYKILTGQEENN